MPIAFYTLHMPLVLKRFNIEPSRILCQAGVPFLLGEETRNSASCCTFLVAEIAVQLAEQGIAVFLGPVSQVPKDQPNRGVMADFQVLGVPRADTRIPLKIQ
jgi:hypothetical protein